MEQSQEHLNLVVGLNADHYVPHERGAQGLDSTIANKKRKLREIQDAENTPPLALPSVQGQLLIKSRDRQDNREKSFKCKYCDYRCTRKDNLNSHMRKHTGEKPYTCDECDYRTARKSSLTVHIRTHTGEKPFRCLTCNSRFSTKSHLNRHSRIHTGEKPFSCGRCHFRSSTKSHLTRHMLKHTGEKPFHCTICDFKCSRNSNLKRHMLTHADSIDTKTAQKAKKSTKARISNLTKQLKDKTTLLEKLRKVLDERAKTAILWKQKFEGLQKQLMNTTDEREKSLRQENHNLSEYLKSQGLPDDEIANIAGGNIEHTNSLQSKSLEA